MEGIKKHGDGNYFWDNPNHQINGLNLPSNLRNRTLQSLLSVGYGSQRDSSRVCNDYDESDNESSNRRINGSSNGNSDGSSYGNSNGTSNDEDYDVSNVEEWSQVFTKDGHFRIDQILPLLPQPFQLSKGHLSMFLQNLQCSRLALAHYNDKNKDAPYELVLPVMSSIFCTYGHSYYHHVNFFAKSKRHDSNSSPELFFAELWACYNKDEDLVLRCCILKPNLLSRYSSGDRVKHFPPTCIFHPEDVTCSCAVCSNCYYDNDDDSLP